MRYLLGSFICAQAAVFGWAKPSNNTLPQTPPPSYTFSDFPLSEDQNGFIEPSLLYWIPFMENMHYGTHISTPNLEVTLVPGFAFNIDNIVKVKNPDFDWSSGVRISLGKYLPEHDKWDITLTGTYFYGSARDKSSVSDPLTSGIAPSFLPSIFFFPFSKASSFWQLNYFTADLVLGRNFKTAGQIVLHPYAGLRSTFQYQEFQSRYLEPQIPPQPPLSIFVLHSSSCHTRGHNNFWGVGPRLGAHLIYSISNHWSLMGHLAGSIVFGKQKMKQSGDLIIIRDTLLVKSQVVETIIKGKDSLYAIRTNLDGYFGIGWESWHQDHTVRVAPSLVLEGTVWYAFNQLWNIWGGDIADFNNRSTRKHGNLALMGLTFNLQIDF